MPQSASSWQDRLTLWVGALLLTFIITTGVLGLIRLVNLICLGTPQIDFGVYYLAGAVLNSHDPDGLFSMTRLITEANERGFERRSYTGPYPYHPFLAVLMRPVGQMPYSSAQSGWQLLNAFMILMSAVPLIMRKSPSIGVCFMALLIVVLYTPGHSALSLGQISPLMLFALSWAFGLLTNESFSEHRLAPIAAGWLIGLASVIRLFPVLLVAWLLWKRRMRVAGWAILSMIIYTVVGAIGGGLSNTIQFVVSFLPSFFKERYYHSSFDNQSFSSALARWLGQNPLVPLLYLLCIGVVLGITCLALFRSRPARQGGGQFALEFALVLTASILLLTYVTLHYYLLLLIPLAALWFSARIASPLLRTSATLGCIALICIHSWAEWGLCAIGENVPFGLVAVLLLWGVLVALVSRTPQPAALRAEQL